MSIPHPEETLPKVGNPYIVLTRGYHYVGRLVHMTALQIILDRATIFVDIGQLDAVFEGRPREAHGRPIPEGSYARITAIGSELIDWPADVELPNANFDG